MPMLIINRTLIRQKGGEIGLYYYSNRYDQSFAFKNKKPDSYTFFSAVGSAEKVMNRFSFSL